MHMHVSVIDSGNERDNNMNPTKCKVTPPLLQPRTTETGDYNNQYNPTPLISSTSYNYESVSECKDEVFTAAFMKRLMYCWYPRIFSKCAKPSVPVSILVLKSL